MKLLHLICESNRLKLGIFLSVLLMVALTGCSRDTRCKPIIAAYPTWPVENFSPKDIRWDYLTHLGVVAIYPLDDGGLNTVDADALLPELLTLAHAHNKKVIISVGGNGEAGKGFLALTKNKATQQAFITNIVNYVNRYGLDGVDIDWEYWTYQNEEGKGGNDPIESRRLVNLLKALREKLPAEKLLTVDVFVGEWVGLQYLSEIEQSVDYVNLMAYDFTGAWSESPIGHHSDYSTFKRALAFAQSQGFSKEKLIVGLPTYGIEFKNGGNESIKHWAYRDIIKQVSPGDNASELLERGRENNLYFETPALTAKKARLIQREGYAGAMLFELTGDTLNPETSLLKRVYDRLQAQGCQSE